MLQRRLFRHGSSERFLERVLVKFISVEGRFWSEPWEFFQTIFLGGRGKRNFGLYLIRAARVLCYMVQRQFGNAFWASRLKKGLGVCGLVSVVLVVVGDFQGGFKYWWFRPKVPAAGCSRPRFFRGS